VSIEKKVVFLFFKIKKNAFHSLIQEKEKAMISLKSLPSQSTASRGESELISEESSKGGRDPREASPYSYKGLFLPVYWEGTISFFLSSVKLRDILKKKLPLEPEGGKANIPGKVGATLQIEKKQFRPKKGSSLLLTERFAPLASKDSPRLAGEPETPSEAKERWSIPKDRASVEH